MNKLVSVDIDATIWDAYPLQSEAAEDIFGEGYSEEECDDWFWLKEKYGSNFWSIFDQALSPENYDRRDLYPNAQDSILKLKSLGYDIHFVTHNTKGYRRELSKWLHSYFGDVGLSVTQKGNKNPILNRLKTDVFIDDSPVHLERAFGHIPHLIAKNHPYNKDFLDSNPQVKRFDDWRDIPKMIFDMSKG